MESCLKSRSAAPKIEPLPAKIVPVRYDLRGSAQYYSHNFWRLLDVLSRLTSASFLSNISTSSSPSLRLEPIIKGVHPEPSCNFRELAYFGRVTRTVRRPERPDQNPFLTLGAQRLENGYMRQPNVKATDHRHLFWLLGAGWPIARIVISMWKYLYPKNGLLDIVRLR